MKEKVIIVEIIRALPDNGSLKEIAERIEFMAGGRRQFEFMCT